jgi:hypothetical protein
MRRLVSGLLVSSLLGSTPGRADQAPGQPPAGCLCTRESAQDLGTGVIWQGSGPLGLHDIASLTAPVLWFSPDEPLLDPDKPTIPQAYPCDVPSEGPVVYYQAARVEYRGAAPVTVPVEDDPAFADKVERLVLRFFFYYPSDIGAGAHDHDLESIEVTVVLDGTDACRRLRVERVEGLAHGSRWYSNILDVQPDTKFPITVLVEEGKHASAPDRNADGAFMRGYDVTTLINDAWGVRDSLGQGVLLTSGYNVEMTKRRTDRDRLLPPEEPRLCVTRRRSSTAGRESLGRYTLRSAHTVRTCTVPVANEFLQEITTSNRFGQQYEPAQFHTGDLRADLTRLDSPDQVVSFSLRRVGGRFGAAVVIRGLDVREGWLVPRLTIDEISTSAEMMFTRSASRWADTYFSVGVRRQFGTASDIRTIDTQNGPQSVVVVTPPNWDGVYEAGFKFRANLPRKMRPFVFGYHFGGIRFGLQGLGFQTIDRWQFIWEIGAGAW